MWATGSFGCERAAYYGETVRDERGRRLRFAMPERVHFGSAIDVLHATLVRRLVDRGEAGDLDSAVDIAFHAGVAGEWSEEHDDDTFRVRLSNAARLLVGEVTHPNQEGVPLEWLDLDGISIQGFDGKSIEVPGVFGDRPLVATPDYLWQRDGDVVGWLDVKSTDRAFSYPDKWLGAESVIYTLACTLHNAGVVPEQIGYMEYRRNAKPYWHIEWTREPTLLNRLAERYVIRWSKALEAGDPDLVSFNPKNCSTCDFARPIDGVPFEPCPIGAILPHQSEGANE